MREAIRHALQAFAHHTRPIIFSNTEELSATLNFDCADLGSGDRDRGLEGHEGR